METTYQFLVTLLTRFIGENELDSNLIINFILLCLKSNTKWSLWCDIGFCCYLDFNVHRQSIFNDGPMNGLSNKKDEGVQRDVLNCGDLLVSTKCRLLSSHLVKSFSSNLKEYRFQLYSWMIMWV